MQVSAFDHPWTTSGASMKHQRRQDEKGRHEMNMNRGKGHGTRSSVALRASTGWVLALAILLRYAVSCILVNINLVCA